MAVAWNAGPELGSRAAGLARPEFLECGKRRLGEREDVVECYKIQISSNTKRESPVIMTTQR